MQRLIFARLLERYRPFLVFVGVAEESWRGKDVVEVFARLSSLMCVATSDVVSK
jgi:hypothetical protein